jgi:hypothetical protein
MSEPIVFISRHRIKEGKLEGFKEHARKRAPVIEADKPQTVAFLSYVNEEGTEVNFIHVFPDAEAMDLHFEGADERTRDAYKFLEPIGFEIYGRPTDQALQVMKQAAEAGPTLTIKSEPLAGYIRLKSD